MIHDSRIVHRRQDAFEHACDDGPVTGEPDTPRPLTRIARQEWERFDPQRIVRTDRAAVYWTAEGWAPCRVVAWCTHYGDRFVRLRTRRDVWRDSENWYLYKPGKLLPLVLDDRDLREWWPRRPLD